MLVGMKAYSLDLRQKILRAYDQPLGSQRALAALFGVSQSFVEKLLRGGAAPAGISRHAPTLGDDGPSAMRQRRPSCAASCKSNSMGRVM